MNLVRKNSQEDISLFKKVPNPPVNLDDPNNNNNNKPVVAEFEKPETPTKQRLEVLYDGYYYDVTDFMERHPGGDLINLYTDTKEDATIPIQQFHYRSLKTVLAKMKGFKRRPASTEEIGLDLETRKRHEELTRDFQQLFKELEAEGIMKPNLGWFFTRIAQNLAMLLTGLGLVYYWGDNFICNALGVIFMTLGGGQCLWLGHEGGHNSFTGIPMLDRIAQTFSKGFIFGLSANCWNYTHTEHHAMPQHETKDADLKTMPLIAFNKRVVRNPKHKDNPFLRYQHLLFILVDTFIVTMTWKLNHHVKFCYKKKHWFDLICMAMHYSLVPIVGIGNWFVITWLGSIYILGNLILSHTHYPVVKEGTKLHWVEYAYIYTTNVRASWWVDWWMGHLNWQIEHHLFPTMPQRKGRLCRKKVKEFAEKHNLPYMVCSYWEAVKMAYNNLEHVAHEIRHL